MRASFSATLVKLTTLEQGVLESLYRHTTELSTHHTGNSASFSSALNFVLFRACLRADLVLEAHGGMASKGMCFRSD